MPLMSTDQAAGIFESVIPTFHLVTAAIGLAIIVMAICAVLATMQLEIGVKGIELGVDIFGGISNDGSKLLVRQRLITIPCQNRFLSSF